MSGRQTKGSLRLRWALVIGAALIQPLVAFFGYSLFGTAINTLSFVPPVIATLFFGFAVGLGFIVVGTAITFLVFLHVTNVPVAEGFAPASVSIVATSVICFGASRLRAYLSARRSAEAAARDREQQYRMIFEHSADGILCLNGIGEIIDANPGVEAHLGWPRRELLGQRLSSIRAFEDVSGESVARLFGDGASSSTTTDIEIMGRRQDGATVQLECSISSIRDADSATRWILMLRNATERRQMEAELHQTKKMAAIGRLAGGVAHDMNNTLNAIMGSAFALRHELNRYGRPFEDLENITSAVDRGAQLTQNLLGFARKSSYIKQPFSLNGVLGTVLGLLRRTVAKNIRIDMHLDDNLPSMEGDLGRIENAVMNLCLNALDAMRDGGRLTLATRSDDGYVTVSVADTGTGMDDAVKEHIFEPFFTTKAAGEGTGLGMSMVYGVVTAHGGKIDIDSAVGQGTTVTLSFQVLSTGRRHSIPSPIPPAPVTESGFLRGKTVLVIDDEPLVLRATNRMLRTLGCKVLTADGGRNGIDTFETNHHRISLVILDLIMPELDGSATLKKVHGINPDIPVLLASGYTDEADKVEALQAEKSNLAFLAKPFRAESLIAALRQLLELESSSSPRAGAL